ncbi:putative leucine-rich repeat receptor-like protein kinase IMK3 [Wolffia australiana]
MAVAITAAEAWDGVAITEADFQGLRAFKAALIDRRGFLKTWNDSGEGACAGFWLGIKCAHGQVISIHLPWRSLAGQLSPAIAQLPALRKLNLHDNALRGPIPSSLAFLPNLRALYLFNNRLSGSIPSSLSLCPLLKTLDLSHNALSGSFPTPPALLRLNLSRNLLSGPLPASLSAITNLTFLDLSYNAFQGPIPSSLAELPSLAFLDLSFNAFSGPVPPSLSAKFPGDFSFRGNPLLSLEKKPISRKKGMSVKDIVLVVVGAVLVVLMVVCCVLLGCLARKRREVKRGEKKAEEEEGEGGGKLVHFDGTGVFAADDLLCATAEIVGKSTYGTVYKATLEDGSLVAVKRLREKMAKGQREFEAEVATLGKVRHGNLLPLRAYYVGPKGEKLLVFDFMPAGSLAAFLHARGPDRRADWSTRKRIMVAAARGLAHLHDEEKMVHGNLTSTNILLDESSDAKLADFGLWRLMSTAANSNVVAAAAAMGYRAPELSKLKKASPKTDVYSLGVVMLELLTGKAPGEAMDGQDLPQWVASIVKEEWTSEVFDLELIREGDGSTPDELLNTLKLALHCVDPSPSARPEVSHVVRQLEEIAPPVSDGRSGSAPPASTSSPTDILDDPQSSKQSD